MISRDRRAGSVPDVSPATPRLAADGLPPLREVVARHGLAPTKALGQNFLFDLNLTGRIARAAGPLAGVTVLEVGPGPGGLTRALLSEGAARVVAVERDARCLPALAEIAAVWPGRLDVVEGDALALDLAALAQPKDRDAPAGPVRIVANLPYNVATPLIAGWLESEPWPPWFDRVVVMVQREVALRLAATPANPKDYGRLAVLAGWRARAKLLFDVPPSAFVPPPKVTSSIVELVPTLAPLACDGRVLGAVAKAAFGQRRKMLRQSLRTASNDVGALLDAAGLAGTLRAEEVPVDGFVRLANALAAERAGAPAA